MSYRRRIFKLLTKMVSNFLNFSTLSNFFILKSIIIIPIACYYYYYFILYVLVVKSGYSSSNGETYYGGQVIILTKTRTRKTLISLIVDVIIRFEFDLDVTSYLFPLQAFTHQSKH